MATRLTPQGEILEGGTDINKLVYKMAALVFGADRNTGIVTIPDDLTVEASFTAENFVDEINSKA